MSTREHWKKVLPVVQAFAEGKEVEFYSSIQEKWCGAGNGMSFTTLKPEEYRIKPEPIEIYVGIPTNGEIHSGMANYLDKEKADRELAKYYPGKYRVVKFREVVDGDQ